VLGAIHRAAYDLAADKERAERIADAVIAGCFLPITWINDRSGHAAVLKLFADALAE
jgi:hypothetical protein